jgi:hypothetical protein
MQLSRRLTLQIGEVVNKRTPSIIAIATTIFAIPPGAIAQTPPWAVGTWKGTISNLRNDPQGPERVLVVGGDGTCRWDYVAKSAAPSKAKSCTVTDNGVSILTGGDATVQLQHKSGKMDGTFQSKGGNSFHVSLTKQ